MFPIDTPILLYDDKVQILSRKERHVKQLALTGTYLFQYASCNLYHISCSRFSSVLMLSKIPFHCDEKLTLNMEL